MTLELFCSGPRQSSMNNLVARATGNRLWRCAMRSSRWQAYDPLWNQIQQFQSEMNQLFNRWNTGSSPAPASAAYPPVNAWEDKDALYVEAELPGLDLKDLDIYVTGDHQLAIKGQRQPVKVEKATWHRQEREFGAFNRVLALPSEIDRDKVQAQFENGVLTITLPKKEAARPRKIQVNAK
jgi:HSP20 family protein